MRERKTKHVSNGIIKMCSTCYKFVGSATFYKHKCSSYFKPEGVKPYLLLESNLHKDEAFRKEILCKFRDNETGKICRENKLIKEMGYRVFCKRRHEEAKQDVCRKVTMSEMRQLANLFRSYRRLPDAPKNAVIEDMFRSGQENTEILYDAIREHGKRIGKKKTKHGSLLNLKAVILRTSKHLLALYDEQSLPDKVKDVESFRRQFNFRDPEVFGEAEYLAVERTFERRRPDELPNEDNVLELHTYIKEQIHRISENFKMENYAMLRNLIVCRLTLYNARRGDEGTRLRTKEWQDAKNQIWIGQEMIESVTDAAEKFLVNQYLLAYLSGKGKSLFPFLYPTTV